MGNSGGCVGKSRGRAGEFRHALAHESAENQAAEFGDVLFSLMQVARWCDIDPVAALQGTNRRFVQRFGLLEQAADKPSG